MRIVINTSSAQDNILLAEYDNASNVKASLAAVVDQHIRALARDTRQRRYQQEMRQEEEDLKALTSAEGAI